MNTKIERIYICSGEVRVSIDDAVVGTVFENPDGTWSARDVFGKNHGDTYISRWAAADQLQLGTGIGVMRDRTPGLSRLVAKDGKIVSERNALTFWEVRCLLEDGKTYWLALRTKVQGEAESYARELRVRRPRYVTTVVEA